VNRQGGSRLTVHAALVITVLGSTLVQAIPTDAEAGTSNGPRVAILATSITLDEQDHTLDGVLKLEPGSIYVFREVGTPRRIDMGEGVSSTYVNPSPRGDRLAAEAGWSRPHSQGEPEVALRVLDSLSRQEAVFPEAVSTAWSPDGYRLAIVHGRYKGEEVPVTDSVSVWDARTGRVTVFRVHPYAVGWFGSDSLLLDSWRGCRLLDLIDGSVHENSYHGSVLSPDREFSIGGSPESGPRIWDERRGIDITHDLEQLIEGAWIRPSPGPFWLPVPGAVLCIPACLYASAQVPGATRSARCSTYVIDVRSRVTMRRIPGRAIGASTDRKAAVLLRGTSLQFVDLLHPE